MRWEDGQVEWLMEEDVLSYFKACPGIDLHLERLQKYTNT
jgi:hypothetical protein